MAAFSCVDDLYRSLIDESQKEKNEEMEESILDTLFRDQKYDLILYALEKGFILTRERVEQIKVSGDLKLYQYLFQHQKLELNSKLMELAGSSGNLETVKWLRKNGCLWDGSACHGAAENGYLEVLKWLRENGCPWSDLTCLYAAMNGHLKLLKWAREHGCPWNGHLEVLKWVRENGCPWDEWTCAYTAEKGQLGVLKWLRENGCPWDYFTCQYAAQSGHLEILKWSRKHGCPWRKKVCLLVVKNYPEIQEWINAN